jgi:hypothetical protein
LATHGSALERVQKILGVDVAITNLRDFAREGVREPPVSIDLDDGREAEAHVEEGDGERVNPNWSLHGERS